MGIKLKLHDKKILYLLTENAKLSDSDIGKKLGISRETVRYRIKRMEDLKIITEYVVICNLEKLGYSTFHIFISLCKANKKREEEIISKISKIKLVNYIATMMGEYDLLVECNARNAVELNDILQEINNKYKDNINKMHINSVLQEYNYPHKYLVEYKREKEEIKFPRYSKIVQEKIDETDIKILQLLSKNARTANTDIAKKIGASADKVTYRIKQMEKKGIIQGYKANVNTVKIGYQRYILLLKIQATEKQELPLIAELRQKKELLYLMRCVGEWNILADLCFKDITKLRETLQDIKSKYSGIIKEDSMLIQFYEHKNQYFF